MKLEDFSLSRKMMLMAIIPGLSYLFLAGRIIVDDIRHLNQDNQLRIRFDTLQYISDLIGDIQMERGTSASYLSTAAADSSKLSSTRSATDERWKALFEAIEANPLLETYGDAMDIQGDMIYARSLVDDRSDIGEVISLYSQVVAELMIYLTNLGNNSPGNLQKFSDNNVILQESREAAGILRANLTSTITSDQPIDTEYLTKILANVNKRDAVLKLHVLKLSHENEAILKDLAKASHWAFIDNTLSTLRQKYKQGDYGISAEETWNQSSRIVEDISRLIDTNLKDASKSIIAMHRESIEGLIIQTSGLLFNISVIIFLPWFLIHSIHQRINKFINDLSRLSGSSRTSSESLEESSEALSRAAQDTAAAVQETVSSMSEINSMVSSTLEKSKQTSTSSQRVEEKVSQGAETVQHLVTAMDGIQKANERLREVNDVMRAISKQTGLINDIVFKTQLLAVNASIESAKAGEHGRGFSVVSEEVSKLAQSSGEAASRITELIENSHEKVSELLNSINESVFSGNEYTEDVQSLFKDILKEVTDISLQAQDMSQAAKEQSYGIEQVTSAVANIDNSTQQNLRYIHEFEDLTSSLGKQSGSLLILSEQLAILGYGRKETGKKIAASISPKPKNTSNTKITKIREPDNKHLADDPTFKPAANE